MTVNLNYAGRRVVSVRVPEGTDEITLEVPSNGGGQSLKKEEPVIVLTDQR
jgi:hypothetical protein